MGGEGNTTIPEGVARRPDQGMAIGHGLATQYMRARLPTQSSFPHIPRVERHKNSHVVECYALCYAHLPSRQRAQEALFRFGGNSGTAWSLAHVGRLTCQK